jgi:DNA-binding transcriptional LysR family regulator
MDWLGLSVLSEVAAGNSLAEAARRLQITPMSATRLLSALEKELGVRLVHRTTRAVALTAEGQAFLPHAKALLDMYAAAHASVRPASEGASGLLRLSTSIAFGRKVVAPFLVTFMRDNPAVKVDLLMSDTLVDIIHEGLDLAIRIADLADSSSLTARRLAPNPRALLASAEYLERNGTPTTLDDLREHDCLTISHTTHWSFKTAEGLSRTKVNGRFSANSIEGLLQACIGGLGIANLSAWFVQDELRSGLLKNVVLVDGAPEQLGVWAVYPTSRMVPAKVRLFIDALGSHLR